MKSAEYMAIVGRFGKKLEKSLMEDLKDSPEMLSDVLADLESKMLAVQSVIINAFLSK